MYGVLFDVCWQTLKGWSLNKNKVKCVRRGKMNLNSGGSDSIIWIEVTGRHCNLCLKLYSAMRSRWDERLIREEEELWGWSKGILKSCSTLRSKNAGFGVHQYIGLFPLVNNHSWTNIPFRQGNLSPRMFIRIYCWIL